MNEHSAPPLLPVTDGGLAAENGLRHGFFDRRGGVSTGLYAALNTGIGSGDARADVLENRRRIAGWLGARDDHLAGCHQIHSADVVTVTAPIALDDRPQADALVTTVPGLALTVLTADCAPILFADVEAGVVGAAHAGWKGALTGVIENTIAAMVGLGAQRARIAAVIGPCIARDNYEVGAEFHARFIDADADNARWFVASDRPDHFRFDLAGYCLSGLRAAGVAARWTGQCTYADQARFFSYRRTTHRGELDYGRQMSAIMIV